VEITPPTRNKNKNKSGTTTTNKQTTTQAEENPLRNAKSLKVWKKKQNGIYFSISSRSYRNTRGSSGELEILSEHKPQASVSTTFSSSANFSLDENMEKRKITRLEIIASKLRASSEFLNLQLD